jgi:hypothetical protein
MRLIWKKYDSEFDPIVTVVGLGFFLGGGYAFLVLAHALRYPIVWALAAVPLLMAVMGVITLIREYELWKQR